MEMHLETEYRLKPHADVVVYAAYGAVIVMLQNVKSEATKKLKKGERIKYIYRWNKQS